MKSSLKIRFIRTSLFLAVCFFAARLEGPAAWSETSDLHIFSDFGADFSQNELMAAQYEMGIWHNAPHVRRNLPKIKKHNPNFKALMYREIFCVLEKETPLQESVGSFKWIKRHHPDWFQRDTKGQMVEVPDYPGRWMMDYGNPGWQAFWIRKTLADLQRGEWDGVFADDALTTVKAHQLPPLAGYPTDEALQEAVYGFLKKAHGEFQKAGRLFIANVSSSYFYDGLWQKWLDVTDGIMEEHFAGDSWTWGSEVAQRQLKAMQLANEKDKWVLKLTFGSWDDETRMQSSLAAHWLLRGEKNLWTYRPVNEPDRPAWHASWEISLGRPLGPAQSSGSLWYRYFEHGAVAVNAGDLPENFQCKFGSRQLRAHEGIILKEENTPLSR